MSLTQKLKICVIINLISFGYVSFCLAATYYVNGAMADDSGNGAAWVTAKKYISSGIGLMSGGDVLYIKDGIYSGAANIINNVPSGSAGAYTKIYAENDWGVTISNPTGQPIQIGTQSDPNHNYIEIRGMKLINYAGNKCSVWGDYVKIIRCAADGASGSGSSFCAYGNYILFEECHSWGGPNRYPFRTSYALGPDKGDYVIFRRCVVRWDYSNTDGPQACFANYDTSYTYYQNCIAIDGTDVRAQDIAYDGLKGFFTPNGADNTNYIGCIVLNMEGAGYWIEDSPVQNITLMDSIAWACKNHSNTGTDGYPPRTFYSRGGVGPLTLDHCTFGGSDWTSRVVDSDLGSGDSIQNSVIANFTAFSAGEYAEDGFDTSDYNNYYGNSGNRNKNGVFGAHSTTVNPFTNSLLYLTRIETGSALSGVASDGGVIGATILKKIGVSGTLYGEPGWDTVTDDNLWPFPNEEVVRNDMREFYMAPGAAYSGSPEISGNRGFCADGTTLTKYIWEYLGNTIPSEIYGSGLSGDLNSDNQVNIQDIQACVNHILGTQDWGARADVNGDGSVNILDAQRIANIILGE